MSPDAAARLALAVYAIAAAAVVAAQVVRSGVSPTVWFLYALNRLYVGGWFHWRANVRCPFPQTGPALIIANHRSPVDPLLLWMNHHLGPCGTGPLRIISFLMAREYYEQRGLKWLLRAVRSIPADRDGRDVGPAREALSRLKEGHLVGVFPEGGLNTGPGLLPFDVGVAWLALRARVRVYPVFIHDSPRGRNMVAPFLTMCRVRVTYGPPIDLSRWHGDRSRTALEEATELLGRTLAELGGVPAPGIRA